MLCWRPKGKIAGILDIKHDARDLVPSAKDTHTEPSVISTLPFSC
jgi:hypothetical protein